MAKILIMVIWGSGELTRDFIHNDDIIEAVMITKDALAPGETLNMGSGIQVTFYELAKRCLEHIGRNIPVECDTTKPEGVFCLL